VYSKYSTSTDARPTLLTRKKANGKPHVKNNLRKYINNHTYTKKTLVKSDSSVIHLFFTLARESIFQVDSFSHEGTEKRFERQKISKSVGSFGRVISVSSQATPLGGGERGGGEIICISPHYLHHKVCPSLGH
jgi:hypothetical protein